MLQDFPQATLQVEGTLQVCSGEGTMASFFPCNQQLGGETVETPTELFLAQRSDAQRERVKGFLFRMILKEV